MKSLMQLARVAYIAHWLHSNGSTDEAEALRAWLALKFDEIQGWVSAARAVADEVKHLH